MYSLEVYQVSYMGRDSHNPELAGGIKNPLAREHLRLPQEHLNKAAGMRDLRVSLLVLLAPKPHQVRQR